MSKIDQAVWASEVIHGCLVNSNGDIDAALSAAEHILSMHPDPMQEVPRVALDRTLKTVYPRDRANRFVDKHRIAEASRSHEKAVELGKELPEEQLTNLHHAMYHLQSDGTIHHPKEDPGLAIDKSGEIADQDARDRHNQEKISAERDSRRKSANLAIKAVRRGKPDLDEADRLLKEAGANEADMRALARARHQASKWPGDEDEMLTVLESSYEEIAERVHQRLDNLEHYSIPMSIGDILLSQERVIGERWQGPSGRWFKKRQDGRVVPTRGPGGVEWRGENYRKRTHERRNARAVERLESFGARDFKRAQFVPPEYEGSSVHGSVVGTVDLDGNQLFYKGVGKYSAEREMIVNDILSTVGVRTPKVRYAIVPGAPVETETYPGEKGGIVSEWINGKTLLELEGEGLSFSEDIEPHLKPGELDRIALMAYLIRMNDRHEGNFMVEGDRLVTLDHEDVLWGEQGDDEIVDEDLGYELMVNTLCIRDTWDYKRRGRDHLDLKWSTPAKFDEDTFNDVASKVDRIAARLRRYNPNIADKVKLQGSVLKQMVKEGDYSYERFRQLDEELVSDVEQQ